MWLEVRLLVGGGGEGESESEEQRERRHDVFLREGERELRSFW